MFTGLRSTPGLSEGRNKQVLAERYSAFFDQSPFPMMIFDLKGRCIEVNHAWNALFGAQGIAWEGYNLLEDLKLMQLGLLPLVRRALQGETVQFPVIEYDPAEHQKTGSKRNLETHLFPVKHQHTDELFEVALVTKDVTERCKLEEELKAKQDELEAAIRGRDEFLSIASHELKTPLTSLRLQSQMSQRVLEREPITESLKEWMIKLMDTTAKQTSRLSRLVEDMLDISRIRHGKLCIDLEEVNLGNLVEEVAERFTAQLQLEGSSIHVAIKDEVIGFWDRYRIEQVILNLVSNGIKYGEGSDLEITVQEANGMARLTVRDSGMGIDTENLERIFGRFERGIPSINISGLGLGLFICRQIVEMHQGKIWAENNATVGSTFFLDLPLAVKN